MDLAPPFVFNMKGGDSMSQKKNNNNRPTKKKLDPIIIVALINGLFAIAIAIIDKLL